MTAVHQHSRCARAVDLEARAYIDRVDRGHYGGRMTTDDCARIYRQAVAHACIRNMREESEPITRYMLRMARLRLEPGQFEPPPEVKEHLEAIQARWKGVFSELCETAQATASPR